MNLASAYGERKTARILTATPFPVNTTDRPVLSLASLIYLACGQFKRTFVLDLQSGVDIMRSLIKTGRHLTPPHVGLYASYKKIP
ncbi:hypothetical protein SAMN05216599_107166 [Pseudomonas cichorii]|nr:hypothetical protein SAMN05216599_107166 [Pseudomonas cichorii]